MTISQPVQPTHLSASANDAFLTASEATRRKAVLFACRSVLNESSLTEELALTALAKLEAGVTADASLAQQLQSLAEALDDTYFTLEETAGEATDESHLFFRRARAATALAAAFGPEPELGHALYEAVHGHDDPEEFERRLEAVLRAG